MYKEESKRHGQLGIRFRRSYLVRSVAALKEIHTT